MWVLERNVFDYRWFSDRELINELEVLKDI